MGRIRNALARLLGGATPVVSTPALWPALPAAPKAEPVISDAALGEATASYGAPLSAWTLPAVPPFATAAAKMALDYAPSTSSVYSWAAQGQFSEGIGFLGYAYLAELSQRPEYRRVSEIFAAEATRKWIKLSGDPDRIDKIEEAMKRLDVRAVVRRVVELDGFFGRGQIFIDLGDDMMDPELSKPLVKEAKIKPGSIKALRIIEPFWSYPGRYDSINPMDGDFYKPRFWQIMSAQVDASRLLTIVGREMPDMLKPAYSFGGLALSQMIKPYVDNWLRTRQSVSDLLHSFSTMVLATDMSTILAAGSAKGLLSRLMLFNQTRDNRGVMAINKETEELSNVSTPLGTLDKLQAQAQEQIASVAGIPLVILLGVTPSGLNASSDGEVRSFYANVKSYQERTLRAPMHTLLDLIQLDIDGKIDPEIGFEFHDLWEMSETDKAQIRKTNADIDSIYVGVGVVDNQEVRDRITQDEESPYFGATLTGNDDLNAPPPTPEELAAAKADDPNNDPDPGKPKPKGKANDAWNEGDHPRAPNGQFFHGALHDFDAFTPSKDGSLGPGVYLTDDQATADKWGAKVTERNPETGEMNTGHTKHVDVAGPLVDLRGDVHPGFVKAFRDALPDDKNEDGESEKDTFDYYHKEIGEPAGQTIAKFAYAHRDKLRAAAEKTGHVGITNRLMNGSETVIFDPAHAKIIGTRGASDSRPFELPGAWLALDDQHWITVHPHGDDHGQPVLIEGSSGGGYTIIGGAGGKLNGTSVNPGSMSGPKGGKSGGEHGHKTHEEASAAALAASHHANKEGTAEAHEAAAHAHAVAKEHARVAGETDKETDHGKSFAHHKHAASRLGEEAGKAEAKALIKKTYEAANEASLKAGELGTPEAHEAASKAQSEAAVAQMLHGDTKEAGKHSMKAVHHLEEAKRIREAKANPNAHVATLTAAADAASAIAKREKTVEAHETALRAHIEAMNAIKAAGITDGSYRVHYNAYVEHHKKIEALKKKQRAAALVDKNLSGDTAKRLNEIQKRYEGKPAAEIKQELHDRFGLHFRDGSNPAAKAYTEAYEAHQKSWSNMGEEERLSSMANVTNLRDIARRVSVGNVSLLRHHDMSATDKTGAKHAANARRALGHVAQALEHLDSQGFKIKERLSQLNIAYVPGTAASYGGISWQHNGVGHFNLSSSKIDPAELAVYSEQGQRRAAEGKGQWGVGNDGPAENIPMHTAIHELAHAIGMHAGVNSPQRLQTILRQMFPNQTTRKEWFKKNISEYGAKDSYEMDAELASKVAGPGYVRGTLPKELENHVDNLFGRATA